jgi:hypothetical protein
MIMSCRLLLLLPLVLSVGCGKEEVEQAINQGMKNADSLISQGVQRAKSEVGMSGSSQITVDGNTQVKQCFLEILPAQDEQPGLLRISSYHSKVAETFPSYLFLAPCDVTEITDLVGKSFSGTMFVRKQSSGPLWHTRDGETTTLHVENVDASGIQAIIENASLACTTDRKTHDLSAKFRCLEIK